MKLLRFFLPRMEYILLLAIFWGVISSGHRILNFDGDLPRHILNGSLILQTGQVSTIDVFSFRTTGMPSFPHEWLSQAIFALAYTWLRLDGIVLLTALLITLTWGLVFQRSHRLSNSLFVSLALTGLGMAASQIHVLPRPHIFSYVLLAVWIIVVENIYRNKSHSWWLLPVLMLVWVNLHGMFVLGMLILAAYLVGGFLDQPSRLWFGNPATKALLLGGGSSLLATFLSPSGPGIWEAIASLGSNAYITSKISEYQSADFHLAENWPFLLLLLLTILGFARTAERSSWISILLVTGFTALALYSSRMIPIFAVVVTPIAAQLTAGWLRADIAQSRVWKTEENIHRLNTSSNGWIWLIVSVLMAVVLMRSGTALDPEGRGNSFDPRVFPVEAVSWLEETSVPEGRMFNEFDWGGYLLLRLWPGQQIFMDGHTHIYGEALTREYERVITLSPGWEDVLEKYDIGWVIMRKEAPLVRSLSSLDAWRIAYDDPTAVILVRR
jgi:hypothetical protein